MRQQRHQKNIHVRRNISQSPIRRHSSSFAKAIPGGEHRGRNTSRMRFSRVASAQRRHGLNRPISSSVMQRERQSNRRGWSARGSSIDPKMFVSKAVPAHEIKEYVPRNAFTDFAIDKRLYESIKAKKYTNPTPIQDQAIPHILEGKDVVGIANTGTGKTAAFLIPLINKTLLNMKAQHLIVVPTRELATQIERELRALNMKLGITSVTCVGGAYIRQQIRQLSYHNHFIIGTPGRLKDLIERKVLNLSHCNSVVLDEADRMLDMGFIHDMKFILSFLPEKHQTLFFSATMSRSVEGLIKEFLKNPVTVSVRSRDTSHHIDQDIVRIERGQDKSDVLAELLREEKLKKVLIFCRTKRRVDDLTKDLTRRGVRVESIHGDKNNTRRQKALDLFRAERIQALVATDVAARGIHITGVSHVINYDIPATYDDYIHRIGRTGRAGSYGSALTFI